MGRYPNVRDFGKIMVRLWIEAVKKKLFDKIAPEFFRWQRDIVNNQQIDLDTLRSVFAVGGFDNPYIFKPLHHWLQCSDLQ